MAEKQSDGSNASESIAVVWPPRDVPGVPGEDLNSASSEEDEDEANNAQENPQDQDKSGTKAKAKAKGKPKLQHKGPEARARDERVLANNALYEHLSDEELEKVLPRTSEGKTTSIGAMLHASAKCAICIFHHTTKGCYNGLRCKFCHAEHESPVRPKRKRKEEGGEQGAPTEQQPGQAGSGKRAKKRRRKKANQAQAGGEQSSDEGTPRQPATLEYGSAWGGDAPGAGGGDWPPLLDERGNSRPCWLQDEHPSTTWPYGQIPPGIGAYGPPPMPHPGGCGLPPHPLLAPPPPPQPMPGGAGPGGPAGPWPDYRWPAPPPGLGPGP